MRTEKMVVYYRMCGIPSTSEPPILKDDKFLLNEVCLRSFIAAFDRVWPRIVFICDYCDPRYEKMIRDIAGKYPIEIKFTELGINGTCLLQYDLFEKESKENVVLFQECDYLYVPNSGVKLMLVEKGFDFITPYDHPDKYQNKEMSEVAVHDYGYKHHFKTTSSTTSTFATTRAKFMENKDLFIKYGYIDQARWLDITGRGNKLWSPIPSLATHMLKDFMAPIIDWENIWNQYLHFEVELKKT